MTPPRRSTPSFSGGPKQQDGHARQQAEQDHADLPAVVGHAELLAQIAAQEKRHGQHAHGDQQVDVPEEEGDSARRGWANNEFTYQGMTVGSL